MSENNVGELLVNVRYANSASPIIGANVRVLKADEVLEDYKTLDSGKTENILLELGVGYQIIVSANGFFERKFELLPISNNKLIQNAELFPLFRRVEEVNV